MGMLDDLALKLWPALAFYLHDRASSRDLGRGTAFPGSGDVPFGLLSGDRFFRTDTLTPYAYNGSTWVALNAAPALVSTFASLGSSPPTINTGAVTAFTFDNDTAGWWSGTHPTRITVPVTGRFLTVARPDWSVDNTTGGRFLEIDQSASGGGAVDGTSFKFPHGESGYNAVPSLSWLWSVTAGDYFIFYNEHNGGVNTLKCDLSVWFQQLS